MDNFLEGPRVSSRGRGRSKGRGRGGVNRGARGGEYNANSTVNTNYIKIQGPEKSSQTPCHTKTESNVEVCLICASDIIHEGLGPCNHRTCHVCSIRMRVLFKDQTCTLCRTPAPYIIITDNRTKRFEDFTEDYFTLKDFASIDPGIGLRFDSQQIREDALWMLGYNCPDKMCDVACLGWSHLHDHTRRAHGRKICDLCSKHRKIFPHEHDLYTDAELSKHMKKGDDNPGAVDQTGFKGHPLCSFCGTRFYGDDELFKHLREKHEKCFLCDRANPNSSPAYYPNYEALRVHFVKDHFMCQEKDCLDHKYIAFVSEFELKAHMLEMHGDSLPKDVRRDVRNVDLSDFSYRQSYDEERRGGGAQRSGREGRESRGRGPGRDSNAESISTRSAQPLRRDEQAFQRQMAIHSAQSVAARTSGSQLTAPTPIQLQVAQATSPFPNVDPTTEALHHLNLAQRNITPSERARALRHTAVIERASILLQNDALKLSQFRSSISSFKSSAVTATALIDSFFILFNEISSSVLGTLIREIADLYEDGQKGDELRMAWNNWRAINEDYPSLPAASNGTTREDIPLGWAVKSGSAGGGEGSSRSENTTTTNRVLKLKNSTAQSSRSSVSQSRYWGSVTTASGSASGPVAGNSSSSFPTLPPPSSRPTASPTKIKTVSWGSSVPGSARPTLPESRSASMTPVASSKGCTDAFPALPKAAKPMSTIFGYGSGMVRRNLDVSNGRSSSVWTSGVEESFGAVAGAGAGPGADPGGETDGRDAEGSGKGKRKANKGKKQVIMNWG